MIEAAGRGRSRSDWDWAESPSARATMPRPVMTTRPVIPARFDERHNRRDGIELWNLFVRHLDPELFFEFGHHVENVNGVKPKAAWAMQRLIQTDLSGWDFKPRCPDNHLSDFLDQWSRAF